MANTTIQPNWIKVISGKFTCSECENTDVILTNTIDGMVEADLDKIKNELKEYPSKVIYGICNVCGMEYTFKLVGEELYLEPSNEEK
jgi:hypothetical protein